MKKAKHFIYFLTALTITVIVSMAGKQQVYAENSGFWSYYVQGDAYITAYSGADSDVTIPSKIGGKKVVGIMNGAFYNNSFLTSITIPSTVKFIGKDTNYEHGVFENCTNLVNVKGMKNVTAIGDMVFKDCNKLTSFNFTGITSIGDYSFMNTGLEKLTLPKMKSMGDFAFSNTPITSLSLKAGSHVGARAFADCDKLTSVVLPSGIIYQRVSLNVINDHVGVFEGCDSLKSVRVEGNIIPKNCFLDCISLSSVEVTSSLKTVDDLAFSGCKGLTTISFPYGLTAINYRAFDGCDSLQTISLPNSLTSMGDYVFSSYNNPDGIFVPSSVTYIGNYCFGFNSGIAISCYKDSTAYTYAVNHKIKYTEKSQISSESLALSSTKFSIEVGNSKQIIATCTPSDTTDCVFWKSNNPSIATVDGAGVITGVAGGTVAIIATTPSGLAKSITVYVNNISTITWSKKYGDVSYWSIKTGKTFTNVAKPYGYYNGEQKNRTDLKVTYKSSDSSVATVDKNGKVTAKKAGMVTITATCCGWTSWYQIKILK